MTHKQARLTRRQRNLELGRMDVLNRCGYCKRAFVRGAQQFEAFAIPGKCCSSPCLESLIERTQESERPRLGR